MALDAAKAVNSLHCWRPQIVHRKLKSTNLLVDTNFHVKISGFGLASLKGPAGNEPPAPVPTSGSRGAIVYKSPEVLGSQSYSAKSDIYSLGIIFWEIASRCATGSYQYPFAEFTFQTEAGFIGALSQGLRPNFAPTIPVPFVSVITRCWDATPSSRPALSDVITLLDAFYKETSSKP